jgi:HmuY protein
MNLKTITFILFSAGLFILTSCFKEDSMVKPHAPGNVTTGKVDMTDNYKYQIYFNLRTDSAMFSEVKTVWDLGFACADSTWQIILNSSKFMKLARTGKTNLSDNFDTTGAKWLFDPSSGNPDSNSVGKWLDIAAEPDVYTNEVYVIDRGMDEEGNKLGARKVQFYKWDNQHYYLRYTNLDGSNPDSCIITKDLSKNYTGFNFSNRGYQIEIEPDRNSWDLLFSQYSTILYTDIGSIPTPYLVLGVLLNPDAVMAAVLFDADFNKVDFEYVKNIPLSSRKDVIGYEWKKYSFISGIYEVNTKNTYIIKDTQGYYYKLRFISFYNNNGDKGYPRFEFVRL